MLEVDVAIEFQAGLDLGDYVGRSLESVVHVVSGLQVAGFVGEFPASELGDLVDFCAFCFEFLRNRFDEIVNAAFEGFCIKNDQALVFAAHWMEVGVDGCVCGSDSPQWRFLGNAQAEQLPEPWQACFQEAGALRW